MKNKIRHLLMMLLLCMMWAVICRADTRPSVFDRESEFGLTISYREGDDGEIAVTGASFVCYKVADFSMEESPISLKTIPVTKNRNGTLINVEDAEISALLSAVREAYLEGRTNGGFVYHGRTDENGQITFEGIDPGIYLVAEEKAAAFHLQSTPFLVSVPESTESGWILHPQAEPKPTQTGSLRIKKEVRGKAGEVSREFHFEVTLATDSSFQWKRSDGAGGSLKSGDMLALKDGEEVLIEGIPAGVAYRVREVEANQENYQTVVKNSNGKMVGLQETVVEFVNSRETKPESTEESEKSGKTTSKTGTSKTGSVRTGDPGRVTALVGVCGAALFTVILLLKKKRGKKS